MHYSYITGCNHEELTGLGELFCGFAVFLVWELLTSKSLLHFFKNEGTIRDLPIMGGQPTFSGTWINFGWMHPEGPTILWKIVASKSLC